MCADGIGYLGVAVTLGGAWALATLAGSLVAGLVPRAATARIALAILALASTFWIVGWTWYGSSELVVDTYAPISGPGYWAQEVGVAAAIGVFSVAVGVVGSLARGNARLFLSIGAAAGLVVAVMLQPGLVINFVPAAGLLVASAIRS
jgi:hypothetical protein